MLSQLIGILVSIYALMNEVLTFSQDVKVSLAVLACIFCVIPLILQFYFFVLSSRTFGFGFTKYVVHQILRWLTSDYYMEMMPYFHAKFPPIFSFGDPFGHKLKEDYIGCVLTMNPDYTRSGEKLEAYDPTNANKGDWMDTSNEKFLHESPYPREIMFCKYIRNCKLSCQYLTYSDTIIVYVGTVDGLKLHEERYTSNMETFCVLSQVFDDLEKQDLYIVDDLKGIGRKRSHLYCTSMRDLLRNLTHGATITKVTQASKKYIRLG